MWPRHTLASVFSPWDHLHPPTTAATTAVLNSRENPAVHKSRLQAFSFLSGQNDDETAACIIPLPSLPLPALRCLQFVGY